MKQNKKMMHKKKKKKKKQQSCKIQKQRKNCIKSFKYLVQFVIQITIKFETKENDLNKNSK